MQRVAAYHSKCQALEGFIATNYVIANSIYNHPKKVMVLIK